VHLGALGRNAHLFRAVEGERTQVAGFEIVGADDFLLRFVQFLGRVGHLHLEDVGRTEQALGVLLQAENRRAALGLVGADALEDAHAVVQGVREDVGGRVAPGHEFAILPNETVAIRHGHADSPCCRL
jgi:hypothetical protein